LSIFACVLLHELGHSLMARYFGIGTRDITLTPIGGVARLESTGNKPSEEIAIALAGPAVNVVIAILLTPLVLGAIILGASQGIEWFFHVDTPEKFASAWLISLWIGNITLVVFNLIPAFPMDGGRVLRAFLALFMSQLRATEIAATVALFMAGGLAVFGVYLGALGMVVVSIFIAFAGQAELAALRHRERRCLRPTEPLLLEAEPTNKPEMPRPVVMPPQLGRFTGFLWDRERRVWVRWVNGRPVELL
jgi:Zn-dependent protease